MNSLLPGGFIIRSLVISCLISVSGCNDSKLAPSCLEFILPNGFAGPFVVVESFDAKPIPIDGKCYRVEVPASGVVAVSSTKPFNTMLEWRAAFFDGNVIPVYRMNDADGVALHSNGWSDRTGHPPRFEFFVGTETEFKDFDFSAWGLSLSSNEEQ